MRFYILSQKHLGPRVDGDVTVAVYEYTKEDALFGRENAIASLPTNEDDWRAVAECVIREQICVGQALRSVGENAPLLERALAFVAEDYYRACRDLDKPLVFPRPENYP